MVRFQFRDKFYALAPPWLTTCDGEKYLYTLQLLSDCLMEKCNQAVKIRFPGLGDVSQIPYLAHDRQLQQGANETDAAFVGRLSSAFETWSLAGSRAAVLQQLGYYLQGKQAGVAGTQPMMAVVGGSYPTVTTWDVVRVGDALGSVPARSTIQPSNFNWDGKSSAWRTWLLLYQTIVPIAGLSGTSGQTGTASASECLTLPGNNVSGVWVPATSGSPVNSPWLAITNLTNLDTSHVGQWITISGSSHSGNNGTFPIVAVLPSTGCVVANPSGVGGDTGPLTWSIGSYPWIGPAGALGAATAYWGQGELTAPPLDTGSNVGGVWQPTTLVAANQGPSASWGLNCPASTIQAVRGLVQQWKSGPTYYDKIVIVFDGGTGAGGSAYSPDSAIGSGNPDGSFGPHGKNISGVWVPTRLISSQFDAYCQGTGSWSSCSVPNMT